MNDTNLLRLVRHLAGEESDAERRATAAWVASDPERAREVAVLRDAWARGGDVAARTTVSDLDVEHAWAALVRRKALRDAPEMPAVALPAARRAPSRGATPHGPALHRPSPGWPARALAIGEQDPRAGRHWSSHLGRAAAVLVVVGGGLLSARVIARHTPARTATAPAMRVVVTRPGQRADVVLADGSRVILGAASRLGYDTVAYGRTARDVQLDGEASFEVRHDAARPFLVRTPRTTVRDLGTRFVLRDYAADAAHAGAGAQAASAAPEVVVAEGAVALAPSRAPATAHPASAPALARPELARPELARLGTAATDGLVVLRPGERGRLLPNGALVRERGVDVDAAFAWTRGELVFRAAPLADAAARLGRWYDVTVLVPDAVLARRPLTATFRDESAAEALRLAAAAVGARLERRPGDGGTFVLRRAGPADPARPARAPTPPAP